MFRKTFALLVMSMLSISGAAQEGGCAPCKPCKPNCGPMKPKPCPPRPCPPDPCCTPPPRCCWKFNPCNPKGCSDMNRDGGFFTADFLYWSSENHGFSYAYQITANPNVGKVLRVDSDWAPAFRFGAGWNTTYDFWDILLNYTWYQNKSSSSESAASGYIPLWPVSTATTGQFGSVSAHAKVLMNMGDFELGRNIYLTKTISLRPHLGMKGGTLHQTFTSHFNGQVLAGSFSDQTFAGENNYWGLGPRAGANGEWHLSKGFSLIGKLAGALLYGETDTNAKTERLTIGASSFAIERHYTDHFSQLVPTAQISLGFQWETCFWCETMLFKTSASWEANCWWNQFNLPVGMQGFNAPLATVGNQPLTMQGLTLNFEWDF